jgi:hypothetical protein
MLNVFLNLGGYCAAAAALWFFLARPTRLDFFVALLALSSSILLLLLFPLSSIARVNKKRKGLSGIEEGGRQHHFGQCQLKDRVLLKLFYILSK